MIRFSDEMVSFVVLFSGIIFSIFGMQGDRVLLMLGGPIQAGGFRPLLIPFFLLSRVTMGLSPFYSLQTIAPRHRFISDSPKPSATSLVPRRAAVFGRRP